MFSYSCFPLSTGLFFLDHQHMPKPTDNSKEQAHSGVFFTCEYSYDKVELAVSKIRK